MNYVEIKASEELPTEKCKVFIKYDGELDVADFYPYSHHRIKRLRCLATFWGVFNMYTKPEDIAKIVWLKEVPKLSNLPKLEDIQIVDPGVTRMVCTNGLVVPEEPSTDLRWSAKDGSFTELSEEIAKDKMELAYFETPSGFHIALDATYIEQVKDFKIKLPTGEVIDTKQMPE